MPGSPTTPGRPGAHDDAPVRVAFRQEKGVGTRNYANFVAQWLACAIPYRRFADILADACARLGANVDRYSFIAVDFHHILLASLLAHSQTGTKHEQASRPLSKGQLKRRSQRLSWLRQHRRNQTRKIDLYVNRRPAL